MCPCRANSSKAKPEVPRTPSSPSFSGSPCFLAPCYLTGDSVRDKCIEMLTAALRVDGEQFWAAGPQARLFLLWDSPNRSIQPQRKEKKVGRVSDKWVGCEDASW